MLLPISNKTFTNSLTLYSMSCVINENEFQNMDINMAFVNIQVLCRLNIIIHAILVEKNVT